MKLYVVLCSVLFIALLLSIADCGDNEELQANQKRKFSKSIYSFLFFLLMLLFWFLTAFRGESIGNDTTTYLGYYKTIADSGVNSSFAIDLGYQYFCLFLSKISLNPYFLLIVCSTVCYFICGFYIYRKSNNILFSLIFLFCIAFSTFTNILRQSIAMVVVLIAYEMIKKKRNIFAICLILLAALFHKSALIALLWFGHKLIPKKPIFVGCIAFVVSVLSMSGVLNTILATVLSKYSGYFTSEYAGTGWLGILYSALRAFVFYLFIYVANETMSEKENSLIISNFVLLLVTVCFGFSVNLFSRASEYFLLPSVVEIPNAFNSGKIKKRNFWMFVTGAIMIAYFLVVLVIRPEWNNLYPYEFSWS